MFAEDSTATWEEFSSILDEFISFSRDHVTILTESIADPVFRQDNPKKPKFIQALYRRNRRRMEQKVIGENTGQCNVDPNLLADHFYNMDPIECDNSIYDWQAAAEEINLKPFLPRVTVPWHEQAHAQPLELYRSRWLCAFCYLFTLLEC